MKKWKQLILVAGLAVCFSLSAKANSQAASQVTGVKQNYDTTSAIGVQCTAVIGAEYYYLELSTDNKNWVTVDTASNPTNLTYYDLNSGSSYYARVGLCSDIYGDEKVAGTVSSSIEVVTAPRGSVTAVQAGAKTNGITVKGATAITGANHYRLYHNKVLLGQSSTNSVTSSAKMNAGTSYWCYFYACRKSASGYVAVGDYDCAYFKTLAPAINTKSFGVSSAYLNINVFYFAVSSAYARDGLQFQFQTAKGKVKKNVYTTGSSVDVRNFIEGTFYKYRVRSYVQCGNTKEPSAWSGFKYIGVSKSGKFKVNSKKKSLTLSWSKISGATGYTVYASTNENSGYKKVKTVSAKKRKITVKKVKGKKIKKNKTYYFRIVPKAKVGKKTYTSQSNAWYSCRFY